VFRINPDGGESLLQVFDRLAPFNQCKGANLSFRFVSNQTGIGFEVLYHPIIYNASLPFFPCVVGNFDFDLSEGTGTFGCDSYENSSVIGWEYQDLKPAFFVFNFFDTEGAYDYLLVYQVEHLGSRKQIGSYSGSSLPPSFVGFNLAFYFTSSEGGIFKDGFFVTYSPYLSFYNGCPKRYAVINLASGNGTFGCSSFGFGSEIERLLQSDNLMTSLFFNFLDTLSDDYVSIYSINNLQRRTPLFSIADASDSVSVYSTTTNCWLSLRAQQQPIR
jgi:hypothetical protein